MKILHAALLPSIPWTGGKTTQLALFPADASYEKRDFIYRLSSARIETDRSVFTNLPGYDRVLVPLEGAMTLFHEGMSPAVLRPMEAYRFDGGWKTVSSGRGADVNLMLRKGRCTGGLWALIVRDQAEATIPPESGSFLSLARYVCCTEGTLLATLGGETAELLPGDLVFSGGAVPFTVRGAGKAVFAWIRY